MDNMRKVLCGGAFDLLHKGHILALEKARSYGDYLIVNVMSDERCRLKKGPSRPIIPASDRADLVKSLRCVDEVVCLVGRAWFPIPTLLRELMPQVLVMDGSECENMEEVLQACKERNVEFVQFDRIKPRSGLDTTEIIRRIREIK